MSAADKVILVTEWSHRAFLSRYPGEPKDKFVFIPNGCDLDDFAHLHLQPQPSSSSPFTIVHAGLLNDSQSWTRSPLALFQAIARIRELEPALAADLTVAFTGCLPEGYRRLVQEMGLSASVKELGYLPHAEYIRTLTAADLLLAINYDGFATLIPGKIYEYWAAGSAPILLLSPPGAAQNLVEKHQLGIAVTPNDVDGITQALLTVYRRREQGLPMRISRNGIERYDRQALAMELAQVLAAAARTESFFVSHD